MPSRITEAAQVTPFPAQRGAGGRPSRASALGTVRKNSERRLAVNRAKGNVYTTTLPTGRGQLPEVGEGLGVPGS